MREQVKAGLMLLTVAAVAVGSLGVVPSAARAQTSPGAVTSGPPAVGGSVGYFGERGQIVISGDFRFNLLHERRSMDAGSDTSYEIQPALDYFVSTNVSVGGVVGIRRNPLGAGANVTSFVIGPRIGYNVNLTAPLSLWIRGGIRYERDSYSGAGPDDGSAWALPLFANAHLLWHPTTHFFIGIGPFLSLDLVAKMGGEDQYRRTDIGLASTIGGYFGGL